MMDFSLPSHGCLAGKFDDYVTMRKRKKRKHTHKVSQQESYAKHVVCHDLQAKDGKGVGVKEKLTRVSGAFHKSYYDDLAKVEQQSLIS
jgi:hypothetical protein